MQPDRFGEEKKTMENEWKIRGKICRICVLANRKFNEQPCLHESLCVRLELLVVHRQTWHWNYWDIMQLILRIFICRKQTFMPTNSTFNWFYDWDSRHSRDSWDSWEYPIFIHLYSSIHRFIFEIDRMRLEMTNFPCKHSIFCFGYIESLGQVWNCITT